MRTDGKDEEPLIDLIRKKNIERNKMLFRQLGLPEDPRLQPPRPSPRKLSSVPRQRTNAAAANAQPPSQRALRSQRGTALDELSSYRLGFDFGYALSLMGYQFHELYDLLVDVYGEEKADQIIDSYCVMGRATGGAGASSGGESVDTEQPMTVAIFARVAFNVVGVALVRFHGGISQAFGCPVAELLLIAVPKAVRGHGIGKALTAYVEHIATKVDPAGAQVIVWRRSGGAGGSTDGDDAELPALPNSSAPVDPAAITEDAPLRAPPHMDSSTAALFMMQSTSQWRTLSCIAAHVVQSLVEADDDATEAAQQAADGLVAAAQALAEDAHLVPAMLDESITAGHTYMALFAEMDAQFFVIRVDSFEEQLKGGSIKTPSAAAVDNHQDTETMIKTSSMVFLNGTWQLEDKLPILYAHTLERIESVVLASDREATIRAGMALDLPGNPLQIARPWTPVGVPVDSPSFRRQTFELLAAINRFDDLGRSSEELRPELATHWHGRTPWTTDGEVLLSRCNRHIERAGESPPSKGEYSKDEPKGWRCSTWEEVASRCKSIDMSNVEAREAEAENEASSSSATTPCTRPRTLELYCGRAGISANYKQQGCDAWFLDRDRGAVEASFAAKPTYHDQTGLLVCKNGLSESRFIHLDFLDFAMAVLRGSVNLGDLHAIHDGLDCSTFTNFAKSHNMRHPSNAWFGTTKTAYETNLRYHYLVALHLFLHRQSSTESCIRSAENPFAGRRFHPLTTNVLEVPKARGGLGMVCASFAFCHVVASPAHSFQKPSNWWCDHKDTLEVFVSADGELKKWCCEECPCSHFRSHAHLRPQAGDVSDAKRGSVYPDELCFLVTNAGSSLMGKVRTLDLDPAYSADGSRDKCTGCGNRQSGGKVYSCQICPDVWHYKCIPRGCKKPRASGDSSAAWFCPNVACQARAREMEGAAPSGSASG